MILRPTKHNTKFAVGDSSEGIGDGVWAYSPSLYNPVEDDPDLRIIVVKDGWIVAHMTHEMATKEVNGGQLIARLVTTYEAL